MTEHSENGGTTLVDDKVPEALAAGLLGIDAARRVGWAKAFAALDLVDTVSEDLRQTRDELKVLRRAYSRLCGFVAHLPVEATDTFKKEMAAHLRAEQTFRFKGAWSLGIDAAIAHKGEMHGWDDEERKAQRAAVKAATNERKAARWSGDKKKTLLRDLRIAAIDAGHTVSTDDTDRESWPTCPCGRRLQRRVVSCSCGAVSEPGDNDTSRLWRLDHETQAVHGVDFAEWSAQFVELSGGA